jgi:ligand-binding sensor domain-containing protein/signal transduction histidine kinase
MPITLCCTPGWAPSLRAGPPTQTRHCNKSRRTKTSYGASLMVLLALAGPMTAYDQAASMPTGAPPQVQIARTTARLVVIDANDIRFSHLSRSQGLSQTRVTGIVQDDQGFIWFATQYGLNRYDGYRFRVFAHDPDNPASICGVYIRLLFKDRAGNLWVGCDYALDRYDPRQEAFTHYRIDPGLVGVNVTIRHISQDANGMLWVSTPNGLYRFDPRSGRTLRFRHRAEDPWSLSSDEVYSSGEDRAGSFWVATAEGLDQFDPETGHVSLHVPLPEPREMAFYEDRRGVFWVFYGSGNGLAILDRERRQLTQFSFAPKDLPNFPLTGASAMLEDRAGNLWVGTFSDGLLKFDPEHQRFIRYRSDATNPESLSEDRVTTLCEDHEGTIWVGLGATEPSYFPSARPSFNALPLNGNNPANLHEKLVNSLYADSEGFLWMGTTGALNRLDRATGEYVHFRVGEGDVASDVLSIVEDRTGALWAGTSGQGLARLDRRTGRFKLYRHTEGDPSSISSDTIPGLFLDREGRLWAATFDGLDEVDSATGRFVAYRHNAQGRGAAYASIAQDARGDLWIGDYFLGLLRFDPATHQFTAFSKPQIGDVVQANVVYVARSGTVWVGTQDGLSALDPISGVLTNYSEKNGLASNAVSCILEDDGGNLWMGTTEGLSRLTPRTKTFKNYSPADGLPGRDLTGWSACSKSATGEMFFGGFAGAVAFHPDAVTDSAYVPPVVLTAFDLFGVPVALKAGSRLPQAIGLTDSLTLPYNQNNFSFEFSALSFRSPTTNRYRYRLDGLDKGWHEVGSDQRLASYTTLPPGDYGFQVQGATLRGPWSEPGKLVRITILPPWWATWWFRIGAGVATLLALWSIYRSQLRRVAREFEIRLNERVRERTRIARELHDSLLQGFQGLMFRLQAVRDLLPDRPSDAAAALETALERGDSTITDAREAVQDLRSSSPVGADFKHALEALWEELKAPHTAFRLVVVGHSRELSPLSCDEIHRIAREALRNAARHANARNIEAEIEYGESKFSLRIRDDGDGIDREVLARGRRAGHWGLPGMRERAEQVGGRLNVLSERGAGTEVELTIPSIVAYAWMRARQSSNVPGVKGQ